ncbi:MAG: hypothetical protein GXP23_05410 [Gammaproteobacteria bacterium]|nr:hypothetical protein [Gammaproteobacteria bacterium]
MKGIVARSTLTRYLSFSEKDSKPDRLKGQSDGQKGFPPVGMNKFSPHELERIAQARAGVTNYDRHLHDVREQLNIDLASRKQELNDAYLGQKEALIRSKESALESLRQESGANSEAYRQLHTEQEEKKENFRRVELSLNRPLQIHFAKVYLLLLFVLAILEVPINKLAVEFFFQESPFLALVLALTIGVVLITLAHFLGLMLRQLGHYRERLGTKGYIAGLFFITFTAGSLIYLISALRQQFVDFIALEQQQNLSTLLLSEGVSGLLGQTIQTELGIAGLTLLVLNVSVFFLGLIFSFLRHDPHPDYERLYFERSHATNRLVKFHRQFEQKATKLQSEFDDKISYLDKKVLALDNEIRELVSRRTALNTERGHDIGMIIDVLRQQVLAYQSGNVDGREGQNIPKYFGESALLDLKERISPA